MRALRMPDLLEQGWRSGGVRPNGVCVGGGHGEWQRYSQSGRQSVADFMTEHLR